MRPLGIYAWFGYDLSLQQSLLHIHSAGFERVMLWWGAFDGDIPPPKQPALARSIGLEVDNAHAPFDGCNSLWLPGYAGDEYIDRLTRCAYECAECEVDTLVVHVTDGSAPPPFCSRGVERLQHAIEAARTVGVTLALENLRLPVYVSGLMDSLKEKEIGICYDSGHALVEFPSDLIAGDDLLLKYADRLTTLHLHDNDGTRDLHCLPYDGIRDWDTLASRLRRASYEGALMLEVQAGDYYENQMDAVTFLQQAWQAGERLRLTMDNDSNHPIGYSLNK